MFKKICYTLGLAVFFLLVVLSIKNANLSGFIDMVENKTFDLRQTIMVNSGVKKASEDIVIVVVDDASYEYILDNYGEWPLPRDIYAKIVDYIETQSPRIVAFDLMFVKSLKSANQADKALADMATGQVKDLHQAAITISKAETSMKLMLEVRNKAISAYKEILRTQI